MKNRPTIMNDDQYEALRDQGYSKEKAARIANTENAGKKGGKAEPYEERKMNCTNKPKKLVLKEGRQ